MLAQASTCVHSKEVAIEHSPPPSASARADLSPMHPLGRRASRIVGAARCAWTSNGPPCWRLEQGQRWRCPSYSPRSTLVVPYSSTQSLATIPLRAARDKDTLLYFR